MDSPSTSCLPAGTTEHDLNLSLSAYLFGANVSWMLLGLLFYQTYTYYQHSKNDLPLIKIAVYTSVIIQIGHTATDSFVAYRNLVRDWGMPTDFLSDGPATAASNVQPFLVAIAGFIVQCFFTRQIWMFANAPEVDPGMKLFMNCAYVFVALLSLANISLVISYTAGIFTIFGPAWVLNTLEAWFVSSAVTDVVITLCMVIALYHAKLAPNFGQSRDKLSGIIRLTIQTGFLTSIIAVVVVPLIFRGIDFYVFLQYLLGKFYVVSLLTNLNSRPRQNSTTQSRDNGTAQLSAMAFTSVPRRNPEDGAISGLSGILRSIGTVTRRHAQTIHFASQGQVEQDTAPSSTTSVALAGAKDESG